MTECTCNKENGAGATTMWFNCKKHNRKYLKTIKGKTSGSDRE